jgi:hypothetical protein
MNLCLLVELSSVTNVPISVIFEKFNLLSLREYFYEQGFAVCSVFNMH